MVLGALPTSSHTTLGDTCLLLRSSYEASLLCSVELSIAGLVTEVELESFLEVVIGHFPSANGLGAELVELAVSIAVV